MSDRNQRQVLGIGILGLGGAAVNMLPAFARNRDFTVAAAADTDPDVLGRFARDYPTAFFAPKFLVHFKGNRKVAQSAYLDMMRAGKI